MNEICIDHPNGMVKFEADPFQFIPDVEVRLKVSQLYYTFKHLNGFQTPHSLCMNVSDWMNEQGALADDILAACKELKTFKVAVNFSFASQLMQEFIKIVERKKDFRLRQQEQKEAYAQAEKERMNAAIDGVNVQKAADIEEKWAAFRKQFSETAASFSEQALSQNR